MKKWIVLFSLGMATLSADYSKTWSKVKQHPQEDGFTQESVVSFTRKCYGRASLWGGLIETMGSSKGEKLNRKIIRFYTTHPKTAEYVNAGWEKLAQVFKDYARATKMLIAQYPQDRASLLAEERVALIDRMLENWEEATKAGSFLYLGVYPLEKYQDVNTWKELVKTQEEILYFYVERAQIKTDDALLDRAATQGVNLFAQLEGLLMEKLKAFCAKSSDPFFHETLGALIAPFKRREDILKYYISLRDETKLHSEVGEVSCEAEEAYAELNEESWWLMKDTLKEHFNVETANETLVDITSDTFGLTHVPERFQ